MTHEEKKQRYLEYREVAREAIGSMTDPVLRWRLQVGSHAHVHPMEDNSGAFVECTLWVPAKEAK